ncbi:MAG TPA: hypothetical protein VF546_22950 [Pyrinomonadaceae bacterium]|jgi:hypothetical protein
MSEQQRPLPNQPPAEQVNESAPAVSTSSIWLALIMELIFVFFPFIVYIFVMIRQGRAHAFFSLTEWAFAATLLFGQTIVKFLLGLMSGQAPKNPIKPVFVTVLILMLGFVPSFLVLVFVLLAGEGGNKGAAAEPAVWFPNGWVVAQLVMFGFAVAAYIYFGGAGEYLRQANEQRRR